MKIIALKGNDRALIAKTTNDVAALMRNPDLVISLGNKTVKTVLMSGSIGKLKRRASGGGVS